MEHLDSVLLGVLDICALVWYARQRARGWLLRLVWITGAMLGFVLVGPLALVVWAGVAAVSKIPNSFGSRKSDDLFDDPDIVGNEKHVFGRHFNHRTGQFDDGADPVGTYDSYP